MAEGVKDSFPQMPVKWWWDLKKQFIKSIPTAITHTYLSSILNLKESLTFPPKTAT
jgi:hypothetical protein